jgi:hypothetical protein
MTAGILLSNQIFQQPWFITLGAFVAFNTVLFVGLSIGKILYWPRIPKSTTFIGEPRPRPEPRPTVIVVAVERVRVRIRRRT